MEHQAAYTPAATRIKRSLAMIMLAAVLALVLALAFLAYLRPAFMLDMANRIVLCL